MVDLNVIWVVGCAGLVLLMQPGFMCLESGLTRSKNSINVAIKNLVDLGVSVCFFWVFGFAVMFGPTLAGWVGSSGFFLSIESDPALAAFFMFQAMFAGTSTTIVSGALAERLKFTGYVAIAVLISGLIYPIFGHWAWNGTNGGNLTGWLGQLGFVDFAGSSVVHSIGGWVSLAALLVVGPRTGRFVVNDRSQKGRFEATKIHGSNLPFSVLGVMLLWVGWMGFNGGSTFALTPQVPSIIVHTILSGASGMMAAGLFGYWRQRFLSPETLINGSLAGLVSITASCHAVTTPAAVLIGAMGGLIMLAATDIIVRSGIDDGVDAVALHGVGGAWGTLALALFGDLELIGTGLSRHEQLLAQLLGVGVAFAWGFGVTYLVLKNLNRIFPLRVSVEEEEIGLNVAEHHAKTEVYELFRVMDEQAKTQNFSLRVPEDPFTEAGKIARRYNDVMDSLEGYAQRINTLNASLEQTVAERTDELVQANAELKSVNQELGRLDQLKDEFLANTSHELRTPLNGIIGLSEYLMEHSVETSPEETSTNLSMIANSGRRLYQLVSDILDFSQILHSRLNLQMKPVGLREVSEIVVALCRPLAMNKAVVLVNEISDDLPLTWADENRLQQVLYNLVGNAVKFTQKGSVTISAVGDSASDAGDITICVADTGIGIPADKFEQIFESFEQASGSTAREYGGLGLGLSVTKKLVELQGGKIWLESVVGVGTQFYFTLPVHQLETDFDERDRPLQIDVLLDRPLSLRPIEQSTADVRSTVEKSALEEKLPLQLSETDTNQQAIAAQLTETFRQSSLDNLDSTLDKVVDGKDIPHVLIVDDDPVNLLVLKNYLSLCNYRVMAAASGHEAMALLAQDYEPDLVILDVMMPRMTGYEVTKAIRDRWQRHELPIVLLTAKNRLEDEVIGLQAGANDYLTKPIVKEGLLARIDTQLSLRQESLARQVAQIERTQFADDLAQRNQELRAAQQKLSEQNHSLEQQVAERTAVLEENQRTLSTLMKNLPGMAYRCQNDPDWSMIFASEGIVGLTGYTPADLDSGRFRGCKQLIIPEEYPHVWAQVQTALGKQQPYQLVYRIVTLSGENKWVWEQGRGVWDAEGELKYLEGFMTDISDRILSEQGLEQSNKELQQAVLQLEETQEQLEVAKERSEAASSAKSDFLANMSHELRTPLNSILGFAQLLTRDKVLQAPQQKRADIIHRSAENLLSLINSILDISEIEAGKITLAPNDFSLHSMIKDVMLMFELKVNQKGIRLASNIDPTVPEFVLADEGKLRQILINLVANAIKFTNEGQVTLSVSTLLVDVVDTTASGRADLSEMDASSLLHFAIQDTGVGIAEDEQARLFEPFEQASAGRAVKQGSGLGLSISQRYAQIMGGTISVSSQLGKGSLFELSIPVATSRLTDTQLIRSQQTATAIHPSEPVYRILVVDDLPENLQLLTELLQSVGFSVRQAANGQEAVDIWAYWHPHFIWMDLLMPVMDGYEAMHQIRSRQAEREQAPALSGSSFLLQENIPKVVISALTASVLKEDAAEIIRLGFDDCVFKPYEAATIWSTLSKHLGVEFIYEPLPDSAEGLSVPTMSRAPAMAQAPSSMLLTADALRASLKEMPTGWRSELSEAAGQLKGRQVLELIDDISDEHSALAHSLRDIAESYEFETLMAMLDTL